MGEKIKNSSITKALCEIHIKWYIIISIAVFVIIFLFERFPLNDCIIKIDECIIGSIVKFSDSNNILRSEIFSNIFSVLILFLFGVLSAGVWMYFKFNYYCETKPAGENYDEKSKREKREREMQDQKYGALLYIAIAIVFLVGFFISFLYLESIIASSAFIFSLASMSRVSFIMKEILNDKI